MILHYLLMMANSVTISSVQKELLSNLPKAGQEGKIFVSLQVSFSIKNEEHQSSFYV